MLPGNPVLLCNLFLKLVLMKNLMHDVDLVSQRELRPILYPPSACRSRRLNVLRRFDLLWIWFHSCASIQQFLAELLNGIHTLINSLVSLLD